MRPKNETILSVLKEPSVPLFGFVYIYLYFLHFSSVYSILYQLYMILFFDFSQKDYKILDFQALIYFENFKRVVLYY